MDPSWGIIGFKWNVRVRFLFVQPRLIFVPSLGLGEGERGEKQKSRQLGWLVGEGFLGGGNSNIFYFHPCLGKVPNLTNIFQMG